MAETTGQSIYIEDAAKRMTNRLLGNSAIRQAHEDAASGKLSRQATGERRMTDVVRELAGLDTVYADKYEETASNIRKTNETLLATSWVNDSNIQIEEANTELQLSVAHNNIMKSYDKQYGEVPDEHKALWDLQKEGIIATTTKRRNAIQKTDFYNVNIEWAKSEVDAISSNTLTTPQQIKDTVKQLEFTRRMFRDKGLRVDELDTLINGMKNKGDAKIKLIASDAGINVAQSLAPPKNIYKEGTAEANAFGEAWFGESAKIEGKNYGQGLYLVVDGKKVVNEKMVKQITKKLIEKYYGANPSWQKIPSGNIGKQYTEALQDIVRTSLDEGGQANAHELARYRQGMINKPDTIPAETGAGSAIRMVASGENIPDAIQKAVAEVEVETKIGMFDLLDQAGSTATPEQVLEYLKQQYLKLKEIHAIPFAKGLNNLKIQDFAEWKATYGDTEKGMREVITKAAEEQRKVTIANLTLISNQLQDGRFTVPKDLSSVSAPVVFDLSDDIHTLSTEIFITQHAIHGLLIGDDGQPLEEAPDINGVTASIYSKFVESVPPEQREQFRKTVADIVLKIHNTKPPQGDTYHHKYMMWFGTDEEKNPMVLDHEGNSITLSDREMSVFSTDDPRDYEAKSPPPGTPVTQETINQANNKGLVGDWGSISNQQWAAYSIGVAPLVRTTGAYEGDIKKKYLEDERFRRATAGLSEIQRWGLWRHMNADYIRGKDNNQSVSLATPNAIRNGLFIPNDALGRTLTAEKINQIVANASGKTDTGFFGWVGNWTVEEAFLFHQEHFSSKATWTDEEKQNFRQEVNSGKISIRPKEVLNGGRTIIYEIVGGDTYRDGLYKGMRFYFGEGL